MATNDFQFVIYQDKQDKWRWYLWNKENREKIADSGQGYYTKAGCENGLNLVKYYGPTAPVVYR